MSKEIAAHEFANGTEQDQKNPLAVEAGYKNLIKRSDYQETSRIQSQAVVKRGMSHDERMDVYRDKVLSLLNGKIEDELFDLFDDRSETSRGSFKANTEVALYSDLVQYLEFCKTANISPLPFGKENLVPYLKAIAQECKRGTIDRRIASLVTWCDIMEWNDLRAIYEVKTEIKKIRTNLKKAKRQAAGFRLQYLIDALDKLNPKIPRDCQDVALLWTGFEILSRESELVALDWEDLELDKDGSGLITIESSKTDKEGEGALQFISPGTVRLLMNWQNVCGKTTGPIFRGVYSNGKLGDRLSTRGVDRAVKRVAKALGLEPSVFSGHSMRVGAAQDMVEEGIETAKIVIAGRWSNDAMLVHYAKRINSKRGAMADFIAAKKKLIPTEQGEQSAELQGRQQLPES